MTVKETAPEYPERECRYGHGPLHIEDEWWQVGKFYPPQENGMPPPLRLGGPVYAMMICVCHKCGYVELFDPEAIQR